MAEGVEFVRGCERDPTQLEKFADCLEAYGMAPESPNQDPRWTHNSASNDTVGFECGRIGSAACGALEIEHVHLKDEVEACKTLAGEAESIMQGTTCGRGDESDHAWIAFYAPAMVDEFADVPESPTEEHLRKICPEVFLPGMHFEVTPLKEEVDRMLQDLDKSDQNKISDETDAHNRLMEWFSEHSDVLSDPFYLCPREPGFDAEVHPAVYPHFMLAVRKDTGGLVGLCSATVWT